MKIRIATFNLENLDDKADTGAPPLSMRIDVLRPQLNRLKADIICFQEVHGQETPGEPRKLLALKKLMDETAYESYALASTLTSRKEVYDKRNLVTLSKFPIELHRQIRNEIVEPVVYKKLTSLTPDLQAKEIKYERPFHYSKILIKPDLHLHLINLHLKSRRPSNIEGQLMGYQWLSNIGWAEGYFISSMKRVSQALEVRKFIDLLFDEEPNAHIVVCGDFNAHPEEVPAELIQGRVENTNNPDLWYRELISCEKSIPESTRYTYLHYGQKRLLDHILISRRMLNYYSHSEIHNETLSDESIAFAHDFKFPESDHAPFVVEFEIR